MNRSRSGSIIQGAFKISTAGKNKYHADLSINFWVILLTNKNFLQGKLLNIDYSALNTTVNIGGDRYSLHELYPAISCK